MKFLEKIKKFPPPGMRNIKTAIAIFICLVLYSLLGRPDVIFAAMSIVICMQGSAEKTVLEGLFRFIGTALGGVSALVFISIPMTYEPILRYYSLCALGIIIIIHTLYVLKMHRAISMACIVYLIIVLDKDNQTLIYAINRTLDTSIGIVIAGVVNHLLFRPTPKYSKKVNILVHAGEEIVDNYGAHNYKVTETEKELTYHIHIDEFIKEHDKHAH